MINPWNSDHRFFNSYTLYMKLHIICHTLIRTLQYYINSSQPSAGIQGFWSFLRFLNSPSINFLLSRSAYFYESWSWNPNGFVSMVQKILFIRSYKNEFIHIHMKSCVHNQWIYNQARKYYEICQQSQIVDNVFV